MCMCSSCPTKKQSQNPMQFEVYWKEFKQQAINVQIKIQHWHKINITKTTGNPLPDESIASLFERLHQFWRIMILKTDIAFSSVLIADPNNRMPQLLLHITHHQSCSCSCRCFLFHKGVESLSGFSSWITCLTTTATTLCSQQRIFREKCRHPLRKLNSVS